MNQKKRGILGVTSVVICEQANCQAWQMSNVIQGDLHWRTFASKLIQWLVCKAMSPSLVARKLAVLIISCTCDYGCNPLHAVLSWE